MVWAEIESPDYPTYVARLRAVGCPEETIRDLVTLDLQKVYQGKARDVAVVAGGKEAVQRLEEEFRRSVAAVLGPEAAERLPSIAAPATALVKTSIMSAFAAEEATGTANGFAPSRLTSFSQGAKTAATSQAESAPRQPESGSPGKSTSSGDAAPAAAASTISTPAPVSDPAGSPTKSDFTNTREYRELAEAARNHGVDQWKVDKAYSMMEEVRDRKLAILQNQDMNEEQRAEALKQAHVEGRRELDLLLGPDTFREYLSKTNRYSWLPMVPSY